MVLFDPQILDVGRSKIRRTFDVIPHTRVNHPGHLSVRSKRQEANVGVGQSGQDGEFSLEVSGGLVGMQLREECGPERPVCLVRAADKQVYTFLRGCPPLILSCQGGPTQVRNDHRARVRNGSKADLILQTMWKVFEPPLASSFRSALYEIIRCFLRSFRRDPHVNAVRPVENDFAILCGDLGRFIKDCIVNHCRESAVV